MSKDLFFEHQQRQHDLWTNVGTNLPPGYNENGELIGDGNSYNMRKAEWLNQRKELFDEYKNLSFLLRNNPDVCDIDRWSYLRKYLNIRN